MPEFVSAYQGDEGNTVVSVTKEYAEAAGLKTLKQPATDRRGRPLAPREGNRTSATTTTSTAAAKTTNGGEAASKPEEASK